MGSMVRYLSLAFWAGPLCLWLVQRRWNLSSRRTWSIFPGGKAGLIILNSYWVASERGSSRDVPAERLYEQLGKMQYLDQILSEIERLHPPVGGGFCGVPKMGYVFAFRGLRKIKGWWRDRLSATSDNKNPVETLPATSLHLCAEAILLGSKTWTNNYI